MDELVVLKNAFDAGFFEGCHDVKELRTRVSNLLGYNCRPESAFTQVAVNYVTQPFHKVTYRFYPSRVSCTFSCNQNSLGIWHLYLETALRPPPVSSNLYLKTRAV